MTIGGTRMDVRMLVDSSSSDTWLASTWCKGPNSECGVKRFDCASDKDCSPTPGNNYLTKEGYKRLSVCYDYPPGCINATVASILIGFTGDTIRVFDKTIGMMNSSTGIFTNASKFDGILGMGRHENLFVFDISVPPPSSTVLENLLGVKYLTKVFFVYFHQGKGKLDLGSEAPSRFKKPLIGYPGASPILWMLLADNVKYGSLEWSSQACEFNTGWPYIGIPDDDFSQIMHAIQAKPVPGTSEYAVRFLERGAKYPDLQFTFAGNTYFLPATMYVAPDTTGRKKYCSIHFAPSHKQYWILGVPWFENIITDLIFPQTLSF
eukprot:Sdes_comp20551_c0_seq3m15310